MVVTRTLSQLCHAAGAPQDHDERSNAGGEARQEVCSELESFERPQPLMAASDNERRIVLHLRDLLRA